VNDYAIEPLSLESADLGELAGLVSAVFEHHGLKHGGSIAFDEATFRFLFASPHADPRLFVVAKARSSGKVVGFLGGIPRRVAVGGRELRLGVPAWVAVEPGHQRQGLALAMGMRLLEIARETGYDGGLAMFEPEAHGIDTARSVARRAGIGFRELFEVDRFLVRGLDVRAASRVVALGAFERIGLRLLEGAPRVSSPRIRLVQPRDHARLHELTSEIRDRTDLAVLHDREDFAWYLDHPSVTCVVHEDEAGEVDGFVSAWQMQLAGFGRKQRFGWLDQVVLQRLTRKSATEVCRALCREALGRGWAGLQSPLIPYFDPIPLHLARFVPHPKKLSVVMMLFGDDGWVPRCRRCYLDWR
jgi:GNAT superfamily N-acetyltransferase